MSAETGNKWWDRGFPLVRLDPAPGAAEDQPPRRLTDAEIDLIADRVVQKLQKGNREMRRKARDNA